MIKNDQESQLRIKRNASSRRPLKHSIRRLIIAIKRVIHKQRHSRECGNPETIFEIFEAAPRRVKQLDPHIREDDKLDPSLQIGVQIFTSLDGRLEYFVL